MKVAFFAAALLLGCSHVGHREVTGPDGTMVYEAFCNGRHKTFGDCMNEAAKTCSGPYEILGKDAQSGFVDTGDQLIEKQKKQMVFRCTDGTPH